MNIYRHGDLLLKQVEKIPKNLRERKGGMVAEGEATGHHHRLVGGQVLEPESPEGKIVYLHIPEAGAIVHEEHSRIDLPAGDYEVVHQREYDPYANAARQVAD